MRRDAVLRLASLAAAAAVALVGCGDIETTGSLTDADASSSVDTGGAVGSDVSGDLVDEDGVLVEPLPAIALGFVVEQLAVGSSWYQYESVSHTVAPRPVAYLVRRGEGAWLFEVVSYYDRRGESGYFTLRGQRWSGTAWGRPGTLSVTQNAKQSVICVSLDALAEVDCSAPHELVLRTELRIVPAAGFAISDPVFYPAGHHTDAEPTAIYEVAGGLADAAPEVLAAAGLRLPSAELSLGDARLGSRPVVGADGAPTRHVHLQATADRQLVAWQLTEVSGSAQDGSVLTLHTRCQPLAMEAAEQAPLSEAHTRELSVVVEPAQPYTVALVDLCPDSPDSARVGRFETALRGQWPRSDTYDLVVEALAEGELVLRLAPGHLAWDWSAANGGSTSLADAVPLSALWGD